MSMCTCMCGTCVREEGCAKEGAHLSARHLATDAFCTLHTPPRTLARRGGVANNAGLVEPPVTRRTLRHLGNRHPKSCDVSIALIFWGC